MLLPSYSISHGTRKNRYTNRNRNTTRSIKYLKSKKIFTVKKKPVNHFENHKIYQQNKCKK